MTTIFEVMTHSELAQRLRIIAANPTYHKDRDNRAALQEAADRLDRYTEEGHLL